MTESDEVIYGRFMAEKNENDLRILLERHRESLILFLNGYVHNLKDAEELMLDAYAEAVAERASFGGKSSFKTWLFSIGKKLALMHMRKNRQFSLLSEEQTAAVTPAPELSILQEERYGQLYQALSKLRNEYREVLILLYFEGMSFEELGSVLRKNRRQTYNLAERGKKALKEELERMGFEYAQYG